MNDNKLSKMYISINFECLFDELEIKYFDNNNLVLMKKMK